MGSLYQFPESNNPVGKSPFSPKGLFCFHFSREEIMKKLQHLTFAFLVAAFALFVSPSAYAATGNILVPFQEDQDRWADAVCASMTEGGCLYFREHEAAAAWSILEQIGAIDVNVYFAERIVILEGGLELWRIDLALFMPDQSESSHEMYATVDSKTHLIDRVVMVDGRLVAGIGE
jgi:hypothetical protein